MTGVTFRRPTEADYGPMVRVIDDWWGGRDTQWLLPRLWLQHFSGTSWLAEAADGQLAGFLVGFLSQDQGDIAYCRLIATNPNLRRHGVARDLYEHFFDDARAAGRTHVMAITWPGNRTSVAFHRALGFDVDDGPGTQNLYGSPAYPAYDFEREDRTVMTKVL